MFPSPLPLTLNQILLFQLFTNHQVFCGGVLVSEDCSDGGGQDWGREMEKIESRFPILTESECWLFILYTFGFHVRWLRKECWLKTERSKLLLCLNFEGGDCSGVQAAILMTTGRACFSLQSCMIVRSNMILAMFYFHFHGADSTWLYFILVIFKLNFTKITSQTKISWRITEKRETWINHLTCVLVTLNARVVVARG